MTSKADHMEELEATAKKLMATTWKTCAIGLSEIRGWLKQFSPSAAPEDDEQLHALYLLTRFLYFDQESVRELLKAVFRDLYRTPILHDLRRSNADTLDRDLLDSGFKKALDQTRFLGVGNPSESGVHLLYYFRQENHLSKSFFINSHELFRSVREGVGVSIKVKNTQIRRYVFIDDLCGSGTQAKEYLKDLVDALKALDHTVRVSYFVLFATQDGLQAVKDLQCFDDVEAVYELDESFRCLEPSSRIFNPPALPFDRLKIRGTCEKFGKRLWPKYPLGYKDGQLLLGFYHNTPDNTLPIFWMPEGWTPIFRRYHKEVS